MKRTLQVFAIMAIGFLVYYFFDIACFSTIQKWGKDNLKSSAVGHIMAYSITIVPLLFSIAIIHSSKKIIAKMGLTAPIFQAILFTLICTLPMLLGYMLKYHLTNIGWNTIVINSISSAFFEEIIFRGFLFGQLYRYTKLGFLPAIFCSSLLFGIAHLYQSTGIVELLLIFAITFLGSILFSWMYAEWSFNLWIPIFLHCFMNLFWLIFSVDKNAMGGIYANIFRILSVLLAIVLTLIYKKKKGTPLEINKKTIWLKAYNH
jgi:membrane protease YdiL (CAAX protease family)